MVTKYDTRKKYIVSQSNVYGNKYKDITGKGRIVKDLNGKPEFRERKYGPGLVVGHDRVDINRKSGKTVFTGGRPIEGEGGKYDNEGHYIPDRLVRNFETDKRAAIRAMNPKSRVRNFIDDGFTREKAEQMVKESPLKLEEYRKKQKTNATKRKPTTTKRKTIRGKK